jgi:hypothetical protein
MDRRKNNGGHSTKGRAGRKPKADEISMIEKMDATLAPEIVWENLSKLVEKKDVQAIKTWLQYRYGMPKQVSELSVNSIEIPKIEWSE